MMKTLQRLVWMALALGFMAVPASAVVLFIYELGGYWKWS
jgi:hypothetical protein